MMSRINLTDRAHRYRAQRENLFGIGETHTHHTRARGGKFQDVKEHEYRAAARRASLVEARRDKAAVAAQKRRADTLNRQFLAKQKREDQAREKAMTKEDKRVRALQQKFESAHRKAASVPGKKRVTDKSVLDELMRNPGGLYCPKCGSDRVGSSGASKARCSQCGAVFQVKKRNSAAGAANAFKDFHGYPSAELVTVKHRVHHHEDLAAAGGMISLDVRPVDKQQPERTLKGFGKDCFLTFNEAGSQLFITGGDQFLSEAELRHFIGLGRVHEVETLGRATFIGYETNKKHLGAEGGQAVYEHQFRTTNEKGQHVVVKITRYPDVIYRVLDQHLEFSGGSYFIRTEGIDK